MRTPSPLHRNAFASKNARALAGTAVALAAGGIVLLRAPRTTTAAVNGSAPTPQQTLVAPLAAAPAQPAAGRAPRAALTGPGVHGSVALTQGAVAANGSSEVFAEVRFAADQTGPAQTPAPVALAVVLDVSGSMSGEKLEQARRAVASLVEQMRAEDRIALVTYSDSARTVQPLAQVGAVRDRLRVVIPTIAIEGGTNIPSGLELGHRALDEAPAGMVRRVVLLSDGQDGSGQGLEQIARSVRTRADQGVTLSSLGIGTDYDERFMARVADAGRGNYEFLRDGSQVGPFLARELQQSSNTTVERAVATLEVPAGWRLDGAFGTEPVGSTGSVDLPLGSLFSGDERRVVARFVVQAGAAGTEAGALRTAVRYQHVRTARSERLEASPLAVRVVATSAEAEASRDAALHADALAVTLSARQQDAVVAWREGRGEEAQQLVQQNLAVLRAAQAAAPTVARAAQLSAFESDARNFNALSAGSEEGRAYGLRSNSVHRRALRSSSAY